MNARMKDRAPEDPTLLTQLALFPARMQGRACYCVQEV